VVRVREGLDEKLAGGGGDASDEGLGGAEEGVAAGEGADGGDGGEGGVELETVDVDELAELEAVGEDEVGVGVGEEDVGGVEGVGEVEVEALVGPEVGASEGGDDSDDLEKRGTVVAGDAGVGVHGLQHFEKNAWGEGSHCCC